MVEDNAMHKDISQKDLLEHIQRVGVIFYEKPESARNIKK